MNYIAAHFEVTGGNLDAGIALEILVAELGELGFESFTESPKGITGFIREEDWTEHMLDEVQILKSDEVRFDFNYEQIEQVNWNREWEKNFEPIRVDDRISVRAPFHEDPGLEFDIVIEPKMSFGTGHHETTHLMLEYLLAENLEGKTVLDMGSGTGILAIFTEMKGAGAIDAIDIDPWCYENSIENVERNGCERIRVFEGDASLLKGKKYDLIIANINRNILLQDIPIYTSCLNEGGILLLSGFYEKDVESIEEVTVEQGLQRSGLRKRNDWVGLKYVN